MAIRTGTQRAETYSTRLRTRTGRTKRTEPYTRHLVRAISLPACTSSILVGGISSLFPNSLVARAGLPRPFEIDPVIVTQIGVSRRTERRFERAAPGELSDIDVKQLGRIPNRRQRSSAPMGLPHRSP